MLTVVTLVTVVTVVTVTCYLGLSRHVDCLLVGLRVLGSVGLGVLPGQDVHLGAGRQEDSQPADRETVAL